MVCKLYFIKSFKNIIVVHLWRILNLLNVVVKHSHLFDNTHRKINRNRYVLDKCFSKFNVFKNYQWIVNRDSNSVGLDLGP